METINNMVYWERGDFKLLQKNLTPEQSIKRHDTRYALFRVQTELNGGNKAEPEHHKISRKILKYEGVGHMLEFAIKWDIGAVAPDFEIVQRLWSIFQEHNQMMNRVAVTIEKGDTAETLAKKEYAVKKKETKRKKAEAKKAKEQKGGS
jgi:hypothetical protein